MWVDAEIGLGRSAHAKSQPDLTLYRMLHPDISVAFMTWPRHFNIMVDSPR